MATTFNWIYLGKSTTAMDPTEGNQTAENAGSFVGQTYGSPGSPLFAKVTSVTTIDNGGTSGALDVNNQASNDQFRTDIGVGARTYTFDGVAVYNATVTYADGTSGTVTAVVAQDTEGNLYLAPDMAAGMDEAVYEAKPIQSLTLNGLAGDTFSGLAASRHMTGFDDGYVDGTGGDDLIDGTYVEPDAGGSDRIDNGDAGFAGSNGDDDHVRVGAGNDTVHAGAGNDVVYGGDGNDLVQGGDGADSLLGEAGDDTLLGGAGNDSLTGGAGNDLLSGGAGNDVITTGSGQDWIDVDPGAGHDVVLDFDMGDPDGDGTTNDQFDVSDLTDAQGNPVKSFDVAVSDDGLGNAVLTFPGGEQITVRGLDPVTAATSGVLFAMGIPCFAEGTAIATPLGDRPVEDIRPGDMVLTAEGRVVPVLWHGARHLGAEELDRRPDLRPVRLAAGLLDNKRDLVLSPQHAVAIGAGRDRVLVRARHLAERLRGARVLRGVRRVSYHHLLLPAHALLLAEGTAVESLYPGPEALRALGEAQRASLLLALGLPEEAWHDPALMAKAYGPRCLPLLAARELAARDLSKPALRAV